VVCHAGWSCSILINEAMHEGLVIKMKAVAAQKMISERIFDRLLAITASPLPPRQQY